LYEEFRIDFDRKRGKTEAQFSFIRNGVAVEPNAVGSAVRQVAGFALRIACIVLGQPRCRQIVVLDEPFVRLRSDKIDRVKTLLETLAGELGIQFVIVTHNASLECGKVIDLGESA